MYIQDIMNTYLFTLSEDDTISDASDVMKLEKIRHIPIVDKDYKLIGLVTHRDLIGALAKRLENFPIKDIMKKKVITVGPHTPLKGAIEVMIINKIGCLPVVHGEGKLIGIVTEIDLLKVLYDTVKIPSDFYIKTPHS